MNDLLDLIGLALEKVGVTMEYLARNQEIDNATDKALDFLVIYRMDCTCALTLSLKWY